MSVCKRPRTDSDGSKHTDVIEIDPRGDVVLRVGTQPSRLLRMSGNLLMRVSDVFQAMLEGKFVEASIKHDASNPLKLPDDDPHAMEVMCKLLMYQIDDVKEIDAGELPSLTVICDKYQCLTSLRVWFQMRLSQYVLNIKCRDKCKLQPWTTGQESLEYLDALAITHLIDDGPNFRKISYEVITQYTGDSIKNGMHKGLADIMPSNFQASLAEQWREVTQDLMPTMYVPIETLLAEPANPRKPCVSEDLRIALYVHHLRNAGCLPPFKVKDAVNILRALETRLRSPAQKRGFVQIKKCKPKCKRCDMDFHQLIVATFDDLWGKIGYLCLGCVKAKPSKLRFGRCESHEA